MNDPNKVPMPSDAEYALFRDHMPRLWRNVYEGCLDQGFNKVQAFILLQTYILSQNPNGIQPGNTPGPESDKPPE